MKKASQKLPEIECACAALRRATRLVTQIYDAEFRPGLNATQFALLTAIRQHSGCEPGALARALGYDKTTVSRNLRLIERNGWIELRATRDGRRHSLYLAPAGAKMLASAKPSWRRAQKRLKSAMSNAEWAEMWAAVRHLTDAASRAIQS